MIGIKNPMVYKGDALSLKDPNSLTNKIGKILEQKHLEKLIDVHFVMDLFYGKNPNENFLDFLESGKRLRVSEENIMRKTWQELEYMLYFPKVTNLTTASWAEFMKKKLL